jgi:hypothetical protein
MPTFSSLATHTQTCHDSPTYNQPNRRLWYAWTHRLVIEPTRQDCCEQCVTLDQRMTTSRCQIEPCNVVKSMFYSTTEGCSIVCSTCEGRSTVVRVKSASRETTLSANLFHVVRRLLTRIPYIVRLPGSLLCWTSAHDMLSYDPWSNLNVLLSRRWS